MALGLVKVPKIYKGLMTSADKQVFSNVKVKTTGSGEALIKFNYTDETYFRQWITRVNATEVTGKSSRISEAVKMEAGSMEERLDDSFTFNHINLLLIAGIYNALPTATQDAIVPAKLKAVLDGFITIRTNKPELFPLDLKDNFIDTVQQTILRDEAIKDIVKVIDAEEDDI